MHLNCPNCAAHLDLVSDSGSTEVMCPSCGSKIDVPHSEPQLTTVNWVPQARERIGAYELLERVGRGSFGEVWRARDTLLNKTVAIKLPRTDGLDERTSSLFLREGQILAQLRHPNIVPVHAILKSDDDRFCIVSDFIEGATLSQLIKARPFQPRDAAEMCRKIALALQHAHERGIVHRDLKPGNILVGNDLEPCVVDFGLARHNSADFTIAADGQVLGTVAYMAPEQAAGANEQVSRQSDIYALGVVLYEMIASHPPFVIGGARVLLYQVLHDDPPPLRKLCPECPRDLETICCKALEKNPQQRYATARDMADDLGRFLDGEPIKARAIGISERLLRKARRYPRLAAFGAAAALIIVALSIALMRSRGKAAPPPFRQAVSMPVLVRHFESGRTLTPVIDLPDKGKAADKVRVAFWRRNPETGEIDFANSMPAFDSASPVTARLIPGHYLVVVEVPQHGFHEVERYVPGAEQAKKLPGSYRHNGWRLRGSGIDLPHVEVPPAGIVEGMVSISGSSDFTVGLPEYAAAPAHHREIEDFFIAPTELTVGEYRATFREQTPSKLAVPPPPDDYPMTGLSYDECLEHAERVGSRLIDEFEWEYAATNGGQSAFPWGNRAPVSLSGGLHGVKSLPFDQTSSPTPVFGLVSNAAEITSSWMTAYPGAPDSGAPSSMTPGMERAVRGDLALFLSQSRQAYGWEELPRARRGALRMASEKEVGLRLARSARPRLRASDFSRVIRPAGQ